MKNRLLIDLVFTLLIYGIVFAVLWVSPDLVDAQILNSGIDPGSDQGALLQTLIEKFQMYASIMLGVSLVSYLIWYVLGEYVVRPNASGSTWYLLWFVLLILILGSAGLTTYLSQVDMGDTKNYTPEYVATFYFASSVLLFYIVSVFFSPTHAKYRIWPAKYIRG
jgi:hypothetical protein